MAPPIPLHLNPGDDAPLYRQLVRQVVEGVAAGTLAPGERLPSLRQLAAEIREATAFQERYFASVIFMA